MRIISGNFKGKKILLPKDKLTRPLKDLTKESIFNILKHSKLLNVELENSNILDLFSGVGSFGLECLSRGAKNITFLESYTEVLNILKKNIDNLNQQNQTKIIEKDIFSENTPINAKINRPPNKKLNRRVSVRIQHVRHQGLKSLGKKQK